MSILDIFKSTPVQPAAPANPAAAPGNTPNEPMVTSASSEATAPNGVVPANTETTPAQSDSPLAAFEKLWEDVPNSKGNNPDPNALLELSPEDVQQVVAKTDFSKSVTAEDLQAISAGGEEAQAAFLRALTGVAQTVLAQSTLVSHRLGTQQIERAINGQNSRLPDMIRDQNVRTHSIDTHPMFADPAIAPIVEQAQSQLAKQFPNETPAQITERAHNFVVSMGKVFNPAQSPDQQSPTTDWDKFLNG
jgi:hypothetical protein